MRPRMAPLKAHEQPLWLVAKVDQRIAFMRHQMGVAGWEAAKTMDIVMTPLDEPPEGSTEQQRLQWEHSCDNCGRFCPNDSDGMAAHVQYETDGVKVAVFFGMCNDCSRRT